jgi:4-hydroxybenzoate polyprenyltransferase
MKAAMTDAPILWLRTLRPRQWTKNLVVFAPLLFAKQVTEWGSTWRALVAFAAFCFVASAGYVINDLRDLKQDRLHPEKRYRPLAAGTVSKRTAVIIGVLSGVAGFAATCALNVQFAVVLASYFAMTTIYTVALKHVVIVDVLVVAIGFVLRAIGGAVAIQVVFSPWLFVCTLLLALFLVLAKRRHELVVVGSSSAHRSILSEYSPHLLDQMIAVVTPAVLLAYTLYTVDPTTIAKFGQRHLEISVVFVLYGLYRYLYLIHSKSLGGRPERLLISDRPLLTSVVLWILTMGFLIYVGDHIFSTPVAP